GSAASHPSMSPQLAVPFDQGPGGYFGNRGGFAAPRRRGPVSQRVAARRQRDRADGVRRDAGHRVHHEPVGPANRSEHFGWATSRTQGGRRGGDELALGARPLP